MTRKAMLRAVQDPPEETPPPPSASTVAQAVAQGSPKAVLEAMRARLAEAFDSPTTPARDLAAISRRLLEVDDRIRAVELADKEAERDNEEASGDEEWSGV